MRRVLLASLAGGLVVGCAGPDSIRPPTDPLAAPSLSLSANASGLTAKASPLAILDDAIDRLAPALGAPGVALGAPLRQIRDSGRLSVVQIDAVQRQLAAFASQLPTASGPDAEALDMALAALRAAADK